MTAPALGAWTRQVIPPRVGDCDDTVAVFCGIYGQRWIGNAIDSLETQTTFPVQVVMAINGHDSRVVERVTDYQRNSRHRVWVAINAVNIGPAGSYHRNRDLIQVPWTIFMHQDDVYLEDHITVMRDMASRSSPKTLGLFTSLGGISEDGARRVAPPPMDNSLLRSAPSWIVVPEIIRQHPFPTPAGAVRTDTQFAGMAWYDSGAPDSEWFTRLACRGLLDATDEVTVLYRQPSDSESSRTDWHTRAWLWSASLDRIFSSPEFYELLCTMPEAHRSTFAEALLKAIPSRYPTSELFRFLQFMAAQRMCETWVYREPVSRAFIAGTLSQWGRSAALESLVSLGAEPASAGQVGSSNLLGALPRRSWADATTRAIYRRYGHRLPARLQRSSLSVYKAWRKGAS